MQCCKTVRAAEPSDLDEVFRIEVESFDKPYPRWYLDLLYGLSGGEYFLVSESADGRITGYIVGIPLSDNACHIASIAVVKECRRRKVGTVLLQSLMELCSSNGYSSFVLEVDTCNYSAQSLYISNMFRPIMFMPNYYSWGRHALMMALIGGQPCCFQPSTKGVQSVT
ncbi:MAG TPA: GNAT family N-acetyltransferase [Pyrodictium delaneyi]|uniref:GNAT family N-acetyltransferase n=1 Tax=Pyrodictium delaneyi TaxID=1273541 RepID=A0A832ZW75_9CREN|nr:GNAT family N-acetyltransferase [Pyrodictium delaneyi]